MQSMKLVILTTFKWSSFGLIKATKLVIIRSSFYNFSMNTKPGLTALGLPCLISVKFTEREDYWQTRKLAIPGICGPQILLNRAGIL